MNTYELESIAERHHNAQHQAATGQPDVTDQDIEAALPDELERIYKDRDLFADRVIDFLAHYNTQGPRGDAARKALEALEYSSPEFIVLVTADLDSYARQCIDERL